MKSQWAVLFLVSTLTACGQEKTSKQVPEEAQLVAETAKILSIRGKVTIRVNSFSANVLGIREQVLKAGAEISSDQETDGQSEKKCTLQMDLPLDGFDQVLEYLAAVSVKFDEKAISTQDLSKQFEKMSEELNRKKQELADLDPSLPEAVYQSRQASLTRAVEAKEEQMKSFEEKARRVDFHLTILEESSASESLEGLLKSLKYYGLIIADHLRPIVIILVVILLIVVICKLIPR